MSHWRMRNCSFSMLQPAPKIHLTTADWSLWFIISWRKILHLGYEKSLHSQPLHQFKRDSSLRLVNHDSTLQCHLDPNSFIACTVLTGYKGDFDALGLWHSHHSSSILMWEQYGKLWAENGDLKNCLCTGMMTKMQVQLLTRNSPLRNQYSWDLLYQPQRHHKGPWQAERQQSQRHQKQHGSGLLHLCPILQIPKPADLLTRASASWGLFRKKVAGSGHTSTNVAANIIVNLKQCFPL